MDKPKEIWVFDHYNPKIMGPATITGESPCGRYLYYRIPGNYHVYIIPKNEAILTRKQAAEACCEYYGKKIKQEQKELDEKKRLLGEFYLEELYG